MRSMVEGVRNESASLLACGLAEPCVQGRRCCVFLRLDGLFRLAMVFGERLIPLTQVRLYIVAMPAFQNRRAALAAARADEAVRPAPFE